MIRTLHQAVGFVEMKTHVTSLVKNADLSAVPKLLETLDVFHPLPRLRQRPVSVGLLIQEANPTWSPKLC